jgi:Pyruvate/2-oxoacid:ferredoxin oxidoreductase delta subunit
MSRWRTWLNRGDVSRFRTWFQLAAFALLVYGGSAAVDLSNNLPTFACPFAGDERGGTCFLFPLQHMLNVKLARSAVGALIGLSMSLLTFVVWFAVLNKAWCGWLCPLGTVQDWITRLRQRLGVRGSEYSEATFRRLSAIKYFFLLLVVIPPLGVANSLFGLPRLPHDAGATWCQLCPARTLLPLFTGRTSELAIDFSTTTMVVLSSLGLLMLGVFLVGSFVKRRFFCLLCPMSALQHLFGRLALLRLSKDGARCTRCGNCARACDIGIPEIATDLETTNMTTSNCMLCLKCVAVCPETDCLQATFVGFPVYRATAAGFFARMGESGLVAPKAGLGNASQVGNGEKHS